MKTIKLMADYQCYPLWHVSPNEFGDIDPRSLPISALLSKELLDWATTYDNTLNWEDPWCSGFENDEAVESFKSQGMKLAEQLRQELGSQFAVTVFLNAGVKQSRS